MNKVISKEIFLKNKILTPKYLTIEKKNFKGNRLNKLTKNKKIRFPVVVKPINEGSSLGVKISRNLKNLKNHPRYCLKNTIRLCMNSILRTRNSGGSFKQ